MIPPITITYSGAVPGHISPKEWRREILKPSWEDVGKWFWRTRMPLRFTAEGGRMLNYSPRKGQQGGLSRREFWRSTYGRKVKRGRPDPLVWSGRSKAQALSMATIRAGVDGKGVRVTMRAPTLNLRHAKSDIRMNEEVRRIAPQEYPLIQERLDRAVQRYIGAFNKRSRVTA